MPTPSRALRPLRVLPLAVAVFQIGSASAPVPAAATAQTGVCYAATGVVDGGRLFTIDLTTGTATLINDAPTAFAIPGLAIRADGTMFATDQDPELNTVDVSTGALAVVGALTGREIQAIEFDAAGTLWGLDQTNLELVTVNPANAAVTVVATIGDDMAGIAIDPTDGTLWASASGEAQNKDAIYTIDKVTGATTLVGTTGLGGATPGLCFDASGNLYAVKGGGGRANDLISVDKATGAGTVIGSTGIFSVSALAMRIPSAVGVGTLAGASAAPRSLPQLAGSHPSPFRTSTLLRLALPRAASVQLSIHDITGRRVRTLVDGPRDAGRHDIAWDGRTDAGAPLPAGVYLARMQSGGVVDVSKAVLVR